MSDQNDHVVLNAKIQNLNMEMEWSMAVQSEAIRGFLLTGDTQLPSRESDARKHFAECHEALTSMVSMDRQKQLLALTSSQHDQNNSDYDRILGLLKAGNHDEAVRLAFSETVTSHYAQAMRAMQELDDLGDSLVEQAVQGHNHAEVTARTVILVVGLAGLVAGILCAVFVIRSITRPIHLLVQNIKAIESNDLTVSDLEVTSQDELGDAAHALNSMRGSLHDIVESLAASANS
jgi:methyl-accepting chemotaxis protein